MIVWPIVKFSSDANLITLKLFPFSSRHFELNNFLIQEKEDEKVMQIKDFGEFCDTKLSSEICVWVCQTRGVNSSQKDLIYTLG